MAAKPLSVARNEYMQQLCDITNNAGLPAFIAFDVLQVFTDRMREAAESEFKRDTLVYQQALQKELERKADTTDEKEGE